MLFYRQGFDCIDRRKKYLLQSQQTFNYACARWFVGKDRLLEVRPGLCTAALGHSLREYTRCTQGVIVLTDDCVSNRRGFLTHHVGEFSY